MKPPGKNPDSREIDEAMRRVREAQSLISKALEPEKKAAKESSGKLRFTRQTNPFIPRGEFYTSEFFRLVCHHK